MKPSYQLRIEAERASSAAKRAAGLRYMNGRIAAGEWEARIAEIPDDTRTLTQRVCGDPLPGRSALDRRHGEQG